MVLSYIERLSSRKSRSIEQLHLLFIDLTFPHIIERFLRKKLYAQMNLAEIQQFCNREAL